MYSIFFNVVLFGGRGRTSTLYLPSAIIGRMYRLFPYYTVESCANTIALQLPKAADGKVLHPDRMAQDSPDEQERPTGE
jgi:hypothetical protein